MRVGEDLGLQVVGWLGAEVEAVVVVDGGELRPGVRRRAHRDPSAGDLVEHSQGDRGAGRTHGSRRRRRATCPRRCSRPPRRSRRPDRRARSLPSTPPAALISSTAISMRRSSDRRGWRGRLGQQVADLQARRRPCSPARRALLQWSRSCRRALVVIVAARRDEQGERTGDRDEPYQPLLRIASASPLPSARVDVVGDLTQGSVSVQ